MEINEIKERISIVREMLSANKPMKEIGSFLGVTPQSVNEFLRRNAPTLRNEIKQERDEKIINMVELNKTKVEIAEAINFTVPALYGYVKTYMPHLEIRPSTRDEDLDLKERKVFLRKQEARRKDGRIAREKRDEMIIRLFTEHRKSNVEIARLIGDISPSQVGKVIKARVLDYKRPRAILKEKTVVVRVRKIPEKRIVEKRIAVSKVVVPKIREQFETKDIEEILPPVVEQIVKTEEVIEEKKEVRAKKPTKSLMSLLYLFD
ncbi:MAG: hypothetical protein FWE79_00545 [Firmicutes bacterium]|nr:hypothetical protein [Bacillota bacterium]